MANPSISQEYIFKDYLKIIEEAKTVEMTLNKKCDIW